jgi:hypothetical protein
MMEPRTSRRYYYENIHSDVCRIQQVHVVDCTGRYLPGDGGRVKLNSGLYQFIICGAIVVCLSSVHQGTAGHVKWLDLSSRAWLGKK